MKEKHAFYSNGKRYYKQMVKGKVIVANDADELKQKVDDYKALIEAGKQDYSEKLLGDYIFDWYDKKKQEVQECTAVPYKYAAVEIIKRIGKTRLIDCTPALLESCVQGFANEKLKSTGHYPSQDYIDNMISVLRMIFKQAKKEMIFPYNYAEDISVKTKTERKGTGHRALTEEEINRIINYENRMRPYALFMLLCGLMPEETVPLLWSDITYDEEKEAYYVSVNKTAVLSSSKPTVVRDGKTKTEFRKRTVAIPYPLDEWVAKEMKNHKKSDLIFTDRTGGLLSASALASRWRIYLEDIDIYYNNKKNRYNPTRNDEDRKLTIDRFTQYDLRHTYATMLASIDTPVRKTTALMGHAEASTTDKYYVDFRKIDTTEDVKRLGEKMREISSKSAESA